MNKRNLHWIVFVCCLFVATKASAQRVDSIYVNLYTDSLRKGTFNYINIDGKMQDGRYIPLDSNHVALISPDARFTGNDLWIPMDFSKEKVQIKAILLSDTSVSKTFTVFIKQKPDPELPTEKELLEEMNKNARQRGTKKSGRNK